MRHALLQKLIQLLKDNKFGAALLLPSVGLVAIDFLTIWYISNFGESSVDSRLTRHVPESLETLFIGMAVVGTVLLLITFFRNRKKYTF